MRLQLKAEGVKPLGVKITSNSGSLFGIKVNSKDASGNYTKGMFLNGYCKQELDPNLIYDMEGFIVDNEYNGTTSLKFIVQSVSEHKKQDIQERPADKKHNEAKKDGYQKQPSLDIDDMDFIPF